jgi:hypothetical protein
MVRQKYDDTLDALDALASILMGGDSVGYFTRHTIADPGLRIRFTHLSS